MPNLVPGSSDSMGHFSHPPSLLKAPQRQGPGDRVMNNHWAILLVCQLAPSPSHTDPEATFPKLKNVIIINLLPSAPLPALPHSIPVYTTRARQNSRIASNDLVSLSLLECG